MAWKSWQHGRIWVGKTGRPTYCILVDGKMISTRTHSEEDAIAEIFKNGMATGTPQHHPLSEVLIEKYLADCEALGQS